MSTERCGRVRKVFRRTARNRCKSGLRSQYHALSAATAHMRSRRAAIFCSCSGVRANRAAHTAMRSAELARARRERHSTAVESCSGGSGPHVVAFVWWATRRLSCVWCAGRRVAGRRGGRVPWCPCLCCPCSHQQRMGSVPCCSPWPHHRVLVVAGLVRRHLAGAHGDTVKHGVRGRGGSSSCAAAQPRPADADGSVGRRRAGPFGSLLPPRVPSSPWKPCRERRRPKPQRGSVDLMSQAHSSRGAMSGAAATKTATPGSVD